jgi:hypothetical protein
MSNCFAIVSKDEGACFGVILDRVLAIAMPFSNHIGKIELIRNPFNPIPDPKIFVKRNPGEEWNFGTDTEICPATYVDTDDWENKDLVLKPYSVEPARIEIIGKFYNGGHPAIVTVGEKKWGFYCIPGSTCVHENKLTASIVSLLENELKDEYNLNTTRIRRQDAGDHFDEKLQFEKIRNWIPPVTHEDLTRGSCYRGKAVILPGAGTGCVGLLLKGELFGTFHQYIVPRNPVRFELGDLSLDSKHIVRMSEVELFREGNEKPIVTVVGYKEGQEDKYAIVSAKNDGNAFYPDFEFKDVEVRYGPQSLEVEIDGVKTYIEPCIYISGLHRYLEKIAGA